MNKKSKQIIIYMCVIAMFSALAFVVTAFGAFPIFAGAGYLNFSDAFIFAVAALINPWVGGFVGGITGMLADMYAGYMNFAFFTLVIKFIEGVVSGYLFKFLISFGNKSKIEYLWKAMVSFMVGGIIMAALYMIPDYYAMYEDTKIIFVDLGFNTLQGLVNAVLGSFIYVSLYKVKDRIFLNNIER